MTISKIVKAWITVCIKLLLGLIIGLVVLHLVGELFAGILYRDYLYRYNLSWELDPGYAFNLTVEDLEYGEMPGSQGAGTVDGIRVYRVLSRHYRWYGLRKLFRKRVVFETKDRRRIEEFIAAARERMDLEGSVKGSIGCGPVYTYERAWDRFYVVMYDNTHRRAGYFMVEFCKNQDKEYLKILVPDTGNFGGPYTYYNEALIPTFGAIYGYIEEYLRFDYLIATEVLRWWYGGAYNEIKMDQTGS